MTHALKHLLAALAVTLLLPAVAQAERIKDLSTISGVRTNQLIGYGLVVGLDGSGDQTTQTPFTVQSLGNMLTKLGINLPPSAANGMQLKNVAAVIVTATLPSYAKPGQAIDVTVSAMGNAKSLRGGTLMMTPLKGADGNVYAVAQGSVLIAGAGAAAGGSSVTVNHLSAGRVPGGATVERVVEASVGQGDYVNFELHDTDFTTANRVVQSINSAFGGGTARALDGRVVQVRAPQDRSQRVAFLAQVENLNVIAGESPAKVIVNARTGSVVMNQMVKVDACAVAHGNLSVTVSAETKVSQPAPFSGGQTVVTQDAQVEVKTEKGELVNVPTSVNLAEVVKALNAVGASPQDLLAILQAMKSAGALRAELEII